MIIMMTIMNDQDQDYNHHHDHDQFMIINSYDDDHRSDDDEHP